MFNYDEGRLRFFVFYEIGSDATSLVAEPN